MQYEGYTNLQAIGINPGPSNTMVLTTKSEKKNHQPAGTFQHTKFSSSTSGRKAYRSIVNSTTKKGYRSDLRAEAVARASAIKKSQRPVKENERPVKLRGGKKKKAAAMESS